MYILWCSAAWAADASLGDWVGGEEVDGSWTLVDGAAEVSLEGATRLTLDARLRLVSGDNLSLSAGDAVFTADYTAAGGLRLGELAWPFGVAELTWEVDPDPLVSPAYGWEGPALRAPELLAWGGEWLVYYETAGGIGHARNSGGTHQVRLDDPVLQGTSPSVVTDGVLLVLYYGCGSAVCRATSDDGLGFTEEGEVFADASEPSVTRDEAGAWHAWYLDGAGARTYATSLDGVSWTEAGTADDRLVDLGGLAGAYGFEAVYTAGDSLGWARGGPDPTFAAADTDRVPVVSADATSWSPDGLTDPATTVDGLQRHLVWAGADGEAGAIGHATGIPTLGSWADLHVEWDGAVVTVTWNDGPPQEAAVTGVSRLLLSVDGTLEADRADVWWATTADTGDTGPPDTGDTGPTDSGPADTAGEDSAAPDTASAGFLTAAEEFHEPGGFGCAHRPGAAVPKGLAMALAGLFAARRARGLG